MSLVGKIFAVLALIIAVFYVGITTALVSLQENYRQQLVDERAKHKQALDVEQQKYRTLESKRDALSDERDRLAKEATRLEGENKNLRSEWAEALAVNRFQMNIIDDQEKEIRRISDVNTDYLNAIRDKEKVNDTLNERIAELTRQGTELRKARDAFQDRLTETEKDLASALLEIEKLTEDAARYVGIIDHIHREAPDVLRAARTKEIIPPKKAIRGKVTVVDKKLGLVVINAGQRAEVRPGYSFIVFRGDKYIGKIVVDEVFPDVSAAHYSKLDMRTDVEVGDDVTTRLLVDF